MITCPSAKNNSFCLLLPANISPQPMACAKTQPSLPPRARVPALQWLLALSRLPAVCWCRVSRATRAQRMLNVPLSPSISGAGRGIPVARSSKGEVCTEPAELKDWTVMLCTLCGCLSCPYTRADFLLALHTGSARAVLPALSVKTTREQVLAFRGLVWRGRVGPWLAHQPVRWVWLLSQPWQPGWPQECRFIFLYLCLPQSSVRKTVTFSHPTALGG